MLPGELNIAKQPDIRKKISDHKWQGHSFNCLSCGKNSRCGKAELTLKKFCSRACRGRFMSRQLGQNAPNWRGGRISDGNGYIQLYMPEHPAAKRQYIFEHRYVMEQKIGRYLRPDELVHHLNEIKDDNSLDNLVLTTREDHLRLYHRNDIIKHLGDYAVKMK